MHRRTKFSDTLANVAQILLSHFDQDKATVLRRATELKALEDEHRLSLGCHVASDHGSMKNFVPRSQSPEYTRELQHKINRAMARKFVSLLRLNETRLSELSSRHNALCSDWTEYLARWEKTYSAENLLWKFPSFFRQDIEFAVIEICVQHNRVPSGDRPKFWQFVDSLRRQKLLTKNEADELNALYDTTGYFVHHIERDIETECELIRGSGSIILAKLGLMYEYPDEVCLNRRVA